MVDYDLWEWAALNNFRELREYAQKRCVKEIFQNLAKKNATKNLLGRGMSWQVLDALVSEAAQAMVKQLETASAVQ